MFKLFKNKKIKKLTKEIGGLKQQIEEGQKVINNISDHPIYGGTDANEQNIQSLNNLKRILANKEKELSNLE